jgi:hypothetical protein
LTSGPLKKAVVIKQLKPAKNLLRTAGNKRAKVIGAQKPVAMDMLEDFPIAFG